MNFCPNGGAVWRIMSSEDWRRRCFVEFAKMLRIVEARGRRWVACKPLFNKFLCRYQYVLVLYFDITLTDLIEK
jgi:hypothetical protein